MRRLAAVIAAVTAAAALVLWAFRGPLTLRVMERVAASNLGTSLLRELPDGLHVALCGAGSPLPDPARSGPCTAVIAGDRLFVVDAGAGAARVLARMSLPPGEIEAILLTHFHSDHIDGLGELLLQRWAGGSRRTPAPVFGPEGVEPVVAGFARAYAADRGYRIAHHGEQVVPPSGAGAVARPFPTPAEGEAHVLIDEAGLRVRAFRVAHAPAEPAVGYRFDYRGRSVLVSGDTIRSATVEKFAGGVDLLVHDALAPELLDVVTRAARAAGRENVVRITTDVRDYHATPVDAAHVARAAAVGHLLLTHVVPPLPLSTMEPLFVRGVAEVYSGPVTVGRDGTLVQLPADADAIDVSQLL